MNFLRTLFYTVFFYVVMVCWSCKPSAELYSGIRTVDQHCDSLIAHYGEPLADTNAHLRALYIELPLLDSLARGVKGCGRKKVFRYLSGARSILLLSRNRERLAEAFAVVLSQLNESRAILFAARWWKQP